MKQDKLIHRFMSDIFKVTEHNEISEKSVSTTLVHLHLIIQNPDNETKVGKHEDA